MFIENKKLYYLTRSYYPYQKGGGPLMRTGAVKYLKELGWNVVVVMPNYSSKEFIIKEDIIQIPLNYNLKLASYLERIGIYEDYFDKWVKSAFEFLKDKIQKEDILFATSGGELGTIKLGSLLKEKLDCKFVINFRDPIDYSLVNGLKLDNKFHISREKQEQKYLKNSDLIITSSKSNQISLQNKYPKLKIVNNYFGYIKNIDLSKYKIRSSNKLRIAYAGNMGNLQKPEILFEIYEKLNFSDDIELYFIGNIQINKTLLKIQKSNYKNITFIEFLPHNEFLTFMIENIDIGFVSLTNDYLGACVPSKIYEYINLALPMIGALPDGDGKNIINQNNYGIAYKYDEIELLAETIEKFLNRNYLDTIKQNILRDKNNWAMKEKIKEVDKYLKVLNAD